MIFCAHSNAPVADSARRTRAVEDQPGPIPEERYTDRQKNALEARWRPAGQIFQVQGLNIVYF